MFNYISYKGDLPAGNGGGGGVFGGIFGVPVYAPFLRVDTIINGAVDSVNQYSYRRQMYVNCYWYCWESRGVVCIRISRWNSNI